jgi:hypothetical protein
MTKISPNVKIPPKQGGIFFLQYKEKDLKTSQEKINKDKQKK